MPSSRDCAVALLLDTAVQQLELTGEGVFEEEAKDYRIYLRRSSCADPCGPCWSVRMVVRQGIRRDDWEDVGPDVETLAYAGLEPCPRDGGSGGYFTVRRPLRD